jgi:hypothetical protein
MSHAAALAKSCGRKKNFIFLGRRPLKKIDRRREITILFM